MIAMFLWALNASAAGLDPANDSLASPLPPPSETIPEQRQNAGAERWSVHGQNTDILQYHPGFHAKYSGPNSLSPHNDLKETVSLDLLAAVRAWPGAEFHVDGMMWQGFGFNNTRGADGFPNAEAFRVGTKVPNVVFSRVFLRQTIGLGEQKQVLDGDALRLGGEIDVSRLTVTLGKFSAKDIFDNNAFANDGRTQFMNWGLTANQAWDYPADSLGFITGLAAELNQPTWAVRYGFFQMPRLANGIAEDPHYLKAWGMVAELEQRFAISSHPGAVRLLAFLNRAHMGSYQQTIDTPSLQGDITRTRAYRSKYGFGVNAEQELSKGVGAFLRVGWSDGENEAWAFSDVDRTASLGLSLNGGFWQRTNDTWAVAGVFNGISRVHRRFFAAGGTGILAGDGRLTYGVEQIMETYYDFQVWKTVRAALDYQFISNPAFNQDRGPVSVLGARLHWSF